MKSRSFRLRGNVYTLLAELLLLIVGITLSLAIDSWRDDRKQMRTEEAYLLNLKDDLEYDQQLLRSYLNMRKNQLNQLDQLIQFMRGTREALSKDSIVLTFFDLARDNKFLPRTSTYQALTSTGQLNLIRDREIVTALLQLHEIEYEFLGFSRSDVASFRKNFLLPYYLEELDFGGLMNPSEMNFSRDKLSQDQYLENLFIYNRFTLQSVVQSYRAAIESNEKLVELIEQRLN